MRAPLPGGPNSFNFMHFLGKFGKFVCWRPPPWRVGVPSSGKSWIRHWLYHLCWNTLGPAYNEFGYNDPLPQQQQRVVSLHLFAVRCKQNPV